MNPSKLLRRFLENGTRPSSQREASALLDESRSLLASRLPTTAETIQNFTDAEIEKITAGGKAGTLERSHKIFLAKYGSPSASPTAKPAPSAAARPAPAPAATSKPATIHRASSTSTKPSTPSTTAPSPTVTASDFATKPLVMRKTDFDSLTSADKSRFSVAGGRLI
jgi:hypothetical protein